MGISFFVRQGFGLYIAVINRKEKPWSSYIFNGTLTSIFFFILSLFSFTRSNCSNFNRISRHFFVVHKNRVQYTNRKFDWLSGHLPWTYIHCFLEVQKHSVILIKIYANVKGGSVLEGSLHKTSLIKTELKLIFFICPRDKKEPKLTFVSTSARDRVDISSGIVSRGFQPLDIYLLVFVGDSFTTV